MAVFAITFRIKSDDDYDIRYAAMTAAIEDASGDEFWDEPSSFYLIRSTLNAQQLRDKICRNSRMDSSTDILLIIDLSSKEYCQEGADYPSTLATYLENR